MTTLVANSYGGEGRLRVLLYAMPWCSIGASWLWARTGQLRRGWLVAGHLGLATTLFALPFLGHEDLNMMSRDEVAAARFVADPARIGPKHQGATCQAVRLAQMPRGKAGKALK